MHVAGRGHVRAAELVHRRVGAPVQDRFVNEIRRPASGAHLSLDLRREAPEVRPYDWRPDRVIEELAAVVAGVARCLWGEVMSLGRQFVAETRRRIRRRRRSGSDAQWHHVVEQTPGSNVTQFGATSIHNTSNIVRLDTAVHRQVSGYYSSFQPFTGRQTVRQSSSSQPFDAQTQFGLDVLREAKKRIRLLEQENEVLRRAAAYLSPPSSAPVVDAPHCPESGHSSAPTRSQLLGKSSNSQVSSSATSSE